VLILNLAIVPAVEGRRLVGQRQGFNFADAVVAGGIVLLEGEFLELS
jgi:hypothetical protein